MVTLFFGNLGFESLVAIVLLFVFVVLPAAFLVALIRYFWRKSK